MGAGRFSWVKVDVFPVVAAVGVGVAFSVYSIVRNLTTNPEVCVSKAYRQEGVPESGTIEQKAAVHNQGSVYKQLQAARAQKDPSQGRTRIF